MAVKKKKAAAKKKTTAKKKAKSPAKAKKKAVKKKAAPKKATKKKATKKKAAAKKSVAKKSPAKKVKAPVAQVATPEEAPPKPQRKATPRKLDPLIAKIKQQLIVQRNDLLKMIQSSREVERNVDDITFSNEIDLASSLEGREMAFQLSSRERNELRMIEDALFKMAKGAYGVCEGCSKNIPVKRLQIMPLTPLCIDCQENLEIG